MFRIQLNKKVQNYLSEYFGHYRGYYQKLYEDSWLWNEEQIIDWYIKESQKRKEEIISLVEKYISQDEILWRTLENTIFLHWRTKYIFIQWRDNKKLKLRYILKIEIR